MNKGFDEKAGQWDQQAYRIERARVIAGKIQETVPISKATDVLDFGCGTGLLGFHFAPLARSVTFADTSEGMLDQVQRKANDQNLGPCRTVLLPSESKDTYDLIVSLMVLHHIQDYRVAIAGLIHQVRPQGYLCLSDLDSEDGSFHSDEVVPHNGFDRSEITSILETEGMKVIQVSTGFVNKKVIRGIEREYPVFLVIGRAT